MEENYHRGYQLNSLEFLKCENMIFKTSNFENVSKFQLVLLHATSQNQVDWKFLLGRRTNIVISYASFPSLEEGLDDLRPCG